MQGKNHSDCQQKHISPRNVCFDKLVYLDEKRYKNNYKNNSTSRYMRY